MTKRTNSFVAAAAAAVALVAAAPASATPTIFEANSAGPAAIGAFEGTVIYTSGDRADQFSLKRSVDGGAPTPFATPLSLKGPVTMDMGPGVGRSIAHPAGTPRRHVPGWIDAQDVQRHRRQAALVVGPLAQTDG